jgi:hypothetical protein
MLTYTQNINTCIEPEAVTTLDHAKHIRSLAGKVVADLETIDTMIPAIVSDNIPESFITVCDNLNQRIHANMGEIQLHYLHIEANIVNRLKD